MKHIPSNDFSTVCDLKDLRAQAESIRSFADFQKDDDGQSDLSREIRGYLNQWPLSEKQQSFLKQHSSMHEQKTSHIFDIESQDLADSIETHFTDAIGKKITNISMVFDMGFEDDEDGQDSVKRNHEDIVILCRSLIHNVYIIFDDIADRLPLLSEELKKIHMFLETNKHISQHLGRPIQGGEYYKAIDKKQWSLLKVKPKTLEVTS